MLSGLNVVIKIRVPIWQGKLDQDVAFKRNLWLCKKLVFLSSSVVRRDMEYL